jgi:hypothetical protein
MINPLFTGGQQMKRYLSDSHMDDADLLGANKLDSNQEKKNKNNGPKRYSLVNKSKEDAFDDWLESTNQRTIENSDSEIENINNRKED